MRNKLIEERTSLIWGSGILDPMFYSRETLGQLIRAGPGSASNLAIGVEDQHSNIHADLSEGYRTQATYSSMEHDSIRNAYFRKAIESVCRDRSQPRNWLEIGPGALGTLTKMVLQNLGNQSTILAIEAVQSSVTDLRNALKGKIRDGTLQVLSGV